MAEMEDEQVVWYKRVSLKSASPLVIAILASASRSVVSEDITSPDLIDLVKDIALWPRLPSKAHDHRSPSYTL
jgi:hypothetical protein